MRYFVDQNGKLRGACVVENPVPPRGWSVVEIEGDLPAPMEKLTYHADGLRIDPDFDPESERARNEIARIERRNRITQRMLRDLAQAVVEAMPEAANRPGIKAMLEVEAQIASRRQQIRNRGLR